MSRDSQPLDITMDDKSSPMSSGGERDEVAVPVPMDSLSSRLDQYPGQQYVRQIAQDYVRNHDPELAIELRRLLLENQLNPEESKWCLNALHRYGEDWGVRRCIWCGHWCWGNRKLKEHVEIRRHARVL
jgi:hypothetical protein